MSKTEEIVAAAVDELRTVSFGIYPGLWNEFEIAIINEFGYSEHKVPRRTDILIGLIQGYIDTNSAFLYPEGTVKRMPFKEIEAERQKISSIVKDLISRFGEKRKTTMQVPVSLWSDFHVVMKRKFGIGVPANDIILMLLSNYLEKKKKFQSKQKSSS